MSFTKMMLLLSSSLTLTLAVSVGKGVVVASYKDGKSISKTSEELKSLFYSSIIYWDIDRLEQTPDTIKTEMKQEIMKDLVHITEDSTNCICSRILGPLICDSTGTLHPSICRFQCRFTSKEKEDITPVMVLSETSFQKSKVMCQQWFTFRGDGRKDTVRSHS